MSTTSGQDLEAAYGRITEVVESLDDHDFERPTRASAWTVKELLFHQLLDAQRALAAFVTTTEAEPDVDAVTYWRPFHPDAGDGGEAHARMVQIGASAFQSPAGLVAWWRVFAEATPRAARAVVPGARVETQGHVLTIPDLVSTLVVEATVHHLDLVVDLPDALGPLPAGLAETRRVLVGLHGSEPPEWAELDDTEAVLRGTGREPGGPVLLG